MPDEEGDLKTLLLGKRIVGVEHDEKYTGVITLRLQAEEGAVEIVQIGTYCGDPSVTLAGGTYLFCERYLCGFLSVSTSLMAGELCPSCGKGKLTEGG